VKRVGSARRAKLPSPVAAAMPVACFWQVKKEELGMVWRGRQVMVCAVVAGGRREVVRAEAEGSAVVWCAAAEM